MKLIMVVIHYFVKASASFCFHDISPGLDYK